jgi:lipopolysaccharide export system protein LptA
MIVLTCLFLLTLPLNADLLQEPDNAMKIVSGEVSYHRNEMTLLGDVHIEHPIGAISAKSLTVQYGEKKQQKCHFSSLKIAEDIHIHFSSGGLLSCQRATMNFDERKGFFYGNEEHSDVIFQSMKEEKSIPFEVKAKQMSLELYPETTTDKTELQSIAAENEIRILYDKNYRLFADNAMYTRNFRSSELAMNESIFLSMKDDQSFCEMETTDDDRVYAKKIQIDLDHHNVSLENMHGTVRLANEEKTKEKVQYSARTAIWDHANEKLELKGNVVVSQCGAFQIQTNDSLFIQQSSLQGKRSIASMYAPQNVQISYVRKDDKENAVHTVHCPGPFSFDQQQEEIVLHKAPEGIEAPYEGQVYIEDVVGEAYADCVTIHYKRTLEQICPDKITLEGNVKLFNRFDGHLQESSSVLHYALADRIEYFFDRNEMILSSASSNRVLFFDKVNNIQMSAPSLIMKQDEQTKKNLVHGVGDVRFTFIEKEFEQLKTRFRL